MTPLKKCTKCGEEKPKTLEFFGLQKKRWFRSECRKCVQKTARDWSRSEKGKRRKREIYHQKHPLAVERVKKRTMESLTGLKNCTKCGETKPFDAFYKQTKASNGRKAVCRDCEKKYYKENINSRRRYSREYLAANRDKLNLQQRQNSAGLSASYIKSRIKKSININNVPEDLIELKRIHITLKRIRNERKKEQPANP